MIPHRPLPLGFLQPSLDPPARIQHLGPYLKKIFGERVYKISLDGGYTCPNRDGTLGTGGCAYCAEGSRGLIHRGGITRQIEIALSHRRERIFFAYFQSFTSTYAPFATLRSHWEEALRHPAISGLVISTRPDCLTEDMIRYWQDISQRIPLWIEVGIESLDDGVLKRMNRCHTLAQGLDALYLLGESGIPVCAHLIVGLPGDSLETFYKKLPVLISTPIFGLKIHPFHVVEGAPIAELWKRGKLELLTLDQYVEGVGNLLRLIPEEILIHRLTGAGPGARHLAPRWATAPRVLIRRIEGWLAERNARQGDMYAREHKGNKEGQKDSSPRNIKTSTFLQAYQGSTRS